MASDERLLPGLGMAGVSIAAVKQALAAQGLHVVTDADMRVLEAMAKARIDRDGWFIDATTEQAAGRAELARREGEAVTCLKCGRQVEVKTLSSGAKTWVCLPCIPLPEI